MPFTPIHLGPGLAFKAAGGRHFSFMVFGGSQVLMDIEPLIGILQNKPILHGVTHTLFGAMVIGSLAAATGKPVSSAVLKLLRIPHPPLTWTAAVSGAFAGTYSHIVLDGIMHSDIMPLWPLVSGNPLYRVVDIDQLHIVCLLAGVIGLACLGLKAAFKRRT
ncbi:metal-dependent hydrolase [Xanthomonas sp. 1678]|uniref:metal-dependent hydrolase n=1 Tax=Xanthomonas sp. 1678 TaxID=3158788 RepID=UPI0028568760|nr:membrane-bound metal-dependent hydrolase YbcI (DUF457 family) [Xanthomonas translucens]